MIVLVIAYHSPLKDNSMLVDPNGQSALRYFSINSCITVIVIQVHADRARRMTVAGTIQLRGHQLLGHQLLEA